MLVPSRLRHGHGEPGQVAGGVLVAVEREPARLAGEDTLGQALLGFTVPQPEQVFEER